MAGRGMQAVLALAAGCLAAPWLPAVPSAAVQAFAGAAAAAALFFRPARLPALFLLGALWFLAAASWQLSQQWPAERDRKSTRLNSSHVAISYAVFCLKKKNR